MLRARALALAALALAGCGKPPAPPPAPACDLDARLGAEACAALKAALLPEALPPARGNAHGDDEAAAALGFAVFFDARFSANSDVRCATCHAPESRFGDARPTSTGLARVTRNSPTALNAARMEVVLWDGRADSIWSQPLFALENPKEMGFTRLEVARELARDYRADYEAVFGPLPALADAARFPARGKPGDAAWEAMAPADREAIDRVAANLGKALEAYLRKLAAGRSAFDRFLAGDHAALTDAQREGMVAFAQAGCLACHAGPLLSDQRFHNLGVAAWDGDAPDEGRAGAWAVLAESEFTARGAFWDGPPPAGPAPQPAAADLGAFRTPTLRNLARSAPFMHNGRLATLEEAVRFHLRGGGRSGAGFVGEVDPLLQPVSLSDEQVARLIDFLGALEGDAPHRPWNDWPQR